MKPKRWLGNIRQIKHKTSQKKKKKQIWSLKKKESVGSISSVEINDGTWTVWIVLIWQITGKSQDVE